MPPPPTRGLAAGVWVSGLTWAGARPSAPCPAHFAVWFSVSEAHVIRLLPMPCSGAPVDGGGACCIFPRQP